MKIFRRNKSLMLFLICTLLTTQWTSAHIHLEEQHAHDGDSHQHATQGHAHHPASQHSDVIDAAHPSGEYNVVELEYECTSTTWNKLDDQPDVSFQFVCQLLASYHSPGIKPFYPDAEQASWLSYSTIRARAPPRLAS